MGARSGEVIPGRAQTAESHGDGGGRARWRLAGTAAKYGGGARYGVGRVVSWGSPGSRQRTGEAEETCWVVG
jgi:hypothetical protein